MAVSTYDIVSTFQWMGMMKYWKGKHILLKRHVSSYSLIVNVQKLFVHNHFLQKFLKNIALHHKYPYFSFNNIVRKL